MADYTQDANCQGAWLMDTDEAVSLPDSSQNSNVGVLKADGEPNFATASPPPGGFSTGYYVWDGNNDYVLVTYDSGLPIYNRDSPYSVLFWVKGSPQASFGRVFAEGRSNDNDPIFDFEVDDVDNTIQVFLRHDNGVPTLFDASTSNVIDGTWHHVAWADDGAGDAPHAPNLYIDGNVDATDFSYDPDGNTYTFDRTAFGALYRATPAVYFGGDIDEVAVFDKELNSTEINDIMDNGLEGAVSVGFMTTMTKYWGT